MANTDYWMDLSEAIKTLGISRQALQYACKQTDAKKSEIRTTKIGRVKLYHRADVLKYTPRTYPRKKKEINTDGA